MTSERIELVNWSDPDVQARGWLVRLKSGEATQQDLDVLAHWRSASEENEQSFRRAVRLWDAVGPALGGNIPVTAPARPGMSRRWFLGGAGGLATTALVLMVVSGGTSAPAGARVFETRKGERRTLRLEDQVGVDLNTDSRLFYWADAASPRVALDRGEAIVTANCGAGRQLWATVGDKEVRAQTARFLLRLSDEGVKITCLDGEMAVRSGDETLTLSRGMNAQFQGGVVQADETPPGEAMLAWQRGLLQFENRPAAEVIEELNRYRPGHIYLTGDRSNVRITGVIHLDRVDLAIDHIAKSLNMNVTRLPGGIAILRGT